MIRSSWRYLRLWGYFVRFSVSRAMEFRLDFFFRIFMDTLFYVVNILFYQLIFQNTLSVAGWNKPQVMIFVSGFLLVDAIQMTLFSNNTWWIPIFVNRGDLDYYIIRPVSSLFFLSLRDFAVNSFFNLVIASGIMAWAIHHYPEPLSALKIFGYLLLILGGTFLHYLLSILMLLPVFWTQSNDGLQQLQYQLMKTSERPDRIFKGWVRRVLVTLLPYSLVASFPARLFLEKFDGLILLHFIGVISLFFLLVNWGWNRGLRAYSSASS